MSSIGKRFAVGLTEWMYKFIQMQLEVYFGFGAFSKINEFDPRNLEIHIFRSAPMAAGQVRSGLFVGQ